jgi:hypothetical protein
MPKDVLVQKWICKHKELIPDTTLRRASRFDLTIDKGGNSNTLVPTTAMRPDVLVQKWICKHKGLIPDTTLRRASRFDLTIDKGDNSNTLVPTTTMRPDVTAKRCSCRTRELAEVDSKNSKELVVKGKYAN